MSRLSELSVNVEAMIAHSADDADLSGDYNHFMGVDSFQPVSGTEPRDLVLHAFNKCS